MRKHLILISITASLLFFTIQTHASIGVNGIHDPSTILKDGNTYHVFGTGNQVYHLTSNDLIRWSSASSVFKSGTFPDWITGYVPGFTGNFWAPDLVYMNGHYYLYYSCSTFGSSRSAIGVARTASLNNPSWTDLGMVVSSNGTSTAVNAIDPGLLRDDDGKVYLSYGSWFGGIAIVELDTISGKAVTTPKVVYGGGHQSIEAPALFKRKGIYYLVVNRGVCCDGVNSTYYITVGRSANIYTGYAGWRTLLSKSGKFIGPGHFGLFSENDRHYMSYHYYDGTSNGTPRLDVTGLTFDSQGWPVVKRDAVAEGRYTVTNAKSNLNWELSGCTGENNQPFIQNSPNPELVCQQWDITPVGYGTYKLQSAKKTATDQVIDIPMCNTSNRLASYGWLNNDCQKFRIYEHPDGSFVFSSTVTPSLVISPAVGSTATGLQLGVYTYNGASHDKWKLTQVPTNVAESSFSHDKKKLRIYPNPLQNSTFIIDIRNENLSSEGYLEIVDLTARVVYKENLSTASTHEVNVSLPTGIYSLKVVNKGKVYYERLVITH